MGQVIQMRDYQAKRRRAAPTEPAMVYFLEPTAVMVSIPNEYWRQLNMATNSWLRAFFPGGIDDMGL